MGHTVPEEVLRREVSQSNRDDDGRFGDDTAMLWLSPLELLVISEHHTVDFRSSQHRDAFQSITDSIPDVYRYAYAEAQRRGFSVRLDASGYGAHMLLYARRGDDVDLQHSRQKHLNHASHLLWILDREPSLRVQCRITRIARGAGKLAVVVRRDSLSSAGYMWQVVDHTAATAKRSR